MQFTMLANGFKIGDLDKYKSPKGEIEFIGQFEVEFKNPGVAKIPKDLADKYLIECGKKIQAGYKKAVAAWQKTTHSDIAKLEKEILADYAKLDKIAKKQGGLPAKELDRIKGQLEARHEEKRRALDERIRSGYHDAVMPLAAQVHKDVVRKMENKTLKTSSWDTFIKVVKFSLVVLGIAAGTVAVVASAGTAAPVVTGVAIGALALKFVSFVSSIVKELSDSRNIATVSAKRGRDDLTKAVKEVGSAIKTFEALREVHAGMVLKLERLKAENDKVAAAIRKEKDQKKIADLKKTHDKSMKALAAFEKTLIGQNPDEIYTSLLQARRDLEHLKTKAPSGTVGKMDTYIGLLKEMGGIAKDVVKVVDKLAV